MKNVNKPCGTCKKTKPVSEFNRNKNSQDGYAWYCRDCAKVRQAKYRRENAEANAESQRRYREKNPERFTQYAKEYARKLKQEVDSVATNKGTRWSKDDDLALMRDDITLKQISKELGRSYGSCSARRATLTERAERQSVIDSVRRRISNA